MAKVEWYRRTSWTDRDRDEFNARLNRSRGDSNKAQYLRVQAVHLAEAGLHTEAVELLDRMLREFPDPVHVAQAHMQKGHAFACLGQISTALDEYRAALQAERNFPNVKTNAWLEFAWLVVNKDMSEKYDEASQILDEFRGKSSEPFPILEYQYCTARAIFADFKRNSNDACEYAKRAIAEAAKEHSGLRYHAKLGLVGLQIKRIEKRLKNLARGKTCSSIVGLLFNRKAR